MLSLRGFAASVRGFEATSPCVLRLRSPDEAPSLESDIALVRSASGLERAAQNGFRAAVIVNDETDVHLPADALVPRLITLPAQFAYLDTGDVIALRSASGRIRTLFRQRSRHNAFLVTERCNHYCLMCSQPPRNVDDRWLLDEIKSCLPLIDKSTRSLGFTGGEPLLDWEQFIEVMGNCRDQLPGTAIQVLSNGRAFLHTEIVSAWANLEHPNLTVAIPIYAAVDYIHDYVVQAVGAFDETVLGILKLKDRGQRVEVRVVLHAITAPRIVETCRWLARNLPFVDHVALMGLENTGFAIANDGALWIDPIDYQKPLAQGVYELIAAGTRVSVYNLPRCVLDRSLWPFAVQSISDWKNGYIDECNKCSEKPRCSGFFTSGRPRYSRGISAIPAP
jgi:His-Xaa-Ser system radical SAM maturase HxsC